MIIEELHLLLLLALNKGTINDDKIIISSEHLKNDKILTITDIKDLCARYINGKSKEGIINQFTKVVFDWEKHFAYNETEEDKVLNIKNLYKRYLGKVEIKGKEKSGKYFFKFYFSEKMEITPGELKGEFGRTWIDYKSQLQTTGKIYDNIGIWVCPDNILSNVLYMPSTRKHYGNNIMVLQMIPEEKYLNQNELEYIGNSFKVVHDQTLRSVSDYNALKDHLSSISIGSEFKSAIDIIETIIYRANCRNNIIDTNNIDVGKLKI